MDLWPDALIERGLERIARQPVRWALGLFFGTYVVGGVAFAIVERGASVVDGLWWAYISMTTVGYGDFSPANWFMRGLAYVVVFMGGLSLAIIYATITARITERRLAAHQETPEVDDDLDHIISQIEDLKGVLTHPRVEAALREVHNERKAT